NTGTVSPTGTRILARVPEAGAMSMVVTFSVSTSAISSSSRTMSPSPLSHCVIIPSVMPMPHWGKFTSVATRRELLCRQGPSTTLRCRECLLPGLALVNPREGTMEVDLDQKWHQPEAGLAGYRSNRLTAAQEALRGRHSLPYRH